MSKDLKVNEIKSSWFTPKLGLIKIWALKSIYLGSADIYLHMPTCFRQAHLVCYLMEECRE